jgi:hypothetical protein
MEGYFTSIERTRMFMNLYRSHRILRWPLAALALLVTGITSQAQTVFSDGTFPNADWSASKIADTTPGAAASFSAFQSLSGGNPNAFRETQHSYAGPGGLIVGHLNSLALFTPSLQGQIQTIDGSYDGIVISVGSSNAVGYGLALKQNNAYYTKAGAVFVPGSGWTSRTFTGLTSADFGRVDDASFHPDFTLTGSVLQFGYYTANGSAFGASELSDSGIDNWSVSINAANTPEPGSALAMLACSIMAAGVALRRRRGTASLSQR